MRILVFIISWFCVVAVADVYRWEENGSVHYSDKPQHPGATKIKLPEVSGYTQSQININAVNESGKQQEPKKNTGVLYQLQIVKPIPKESNQDAAGNLDLEFVVTPSLDPSLDHKIRYRVGSQEMAITDLKHTANNIDRGSHVLKAEVIDKDGKTISNITSVEVQIRRPSLLIQENLKKQGIQAPRAN